MNRHWMVAACLLLATVALPAGAGEEAGSEAPVAGAYIRNLGFVGGRAVQLAEAIPADKYGWRPMDGVRSVSESIMHMAGANFYFAGRLGSAPPEGVDPQNLEKISDKGECVALLEQSVEHLSKALGEVGDVHAEADIFGRQGTVEDLLQIAVGHVHEHFGQLIAYARTNGVTPPWSQPAEEEPESEPEG